MNYPFVVIQRAQDTTRSLLPRDFKTLSVFLKAEEKRDSPSPNQVLAQSQKTLEGGPRLVVGLLHDRAFLKGYFACQERYNREMERLENKQLELSR